jgi:hypothetical protein
MDIEILYDSADELEGIVAYYTLGHEDKQEFINELESIDDFDYEISIDSISHEYAKWTLDYDDDNHENSILSTSKTPKKDYFPITIFER